MRKNISKLVAVLLSLTLAISPFGNVVYGNEAAVEEVIGGEEVVEGIEDSLDIDSFFETRSSAMELKDGDTYKLSFHNKSKYDYDNENFMLAIAGETDQQWLSYENTILVIQANSYAYGGDLSGIGYTTDYSGNRMLFEDNIDWDTFAEYMTEGVDCEVTISRAGDFIFYDAVIGEYTVSASAVASVALPEVCYLYLSGFNCELTDISATYSNDEIVVDYLTTDDIPDKNLYAELLEVSDINGDGIIQVVETKCASYVNIYEPVYDFTGLNLFENIHSLYCSYYMYDEEGNRDLEAEKQSMLSLGENAKNLNEISVLSLQMGCVDETLLAAFADKELDQLYISVSDSGEWLGSEKLVGSKLYESVSYLQVYLDEQEEFSLTNIEEFNNLSSIDVYGYYNKITDLAVLNDKKLEGLRLECIFTQEELDSINFEGIGNISLEHEGSDEESVEFDINKLSNAYSISLYDLKLKGDIGSLGEGLDSLALYNCELENTAPDMSKYTSMYYLYISNCGLTDITGLDKLASLSSLDLSNNKLTQAPTISNDVSWLSSIDLSYNNITDISSLVNINNIGESLSWLELNNNKIVSLPDMSVLKNVSYINLSENLLETLEGANLDKLENLTFYRGDDYYDCGLYLYGNKLTVDDIKGYVPQKFSADIEWLSDATSVVIDEYTDAKTFMNSELLAAYIDSALRNNEDSTSFGFNFDTVCDEVVIEEELLEYIRELGITVNIRFSYYDVATKQFVTSVYVNFDDVDEATSSFTIDLDVLDMQLADKSICDILGNENVYSSIKVENYLANSAVSYSGTYYNVYKMGEAGIERVNRGVWLEDILSYIEEGIYPEIGYYYVEAERDTYYNYTDEEGVKSDPEKYEGEAVWGDEIAKLIADAVEGDKIVVATYDDDLMITAEAFNQIIDKKLTLVVKVIENSGIHYEYTVAYDSITKVEDCDYVEFWTYRDMDDACFNVGLSVDLYEYIQEEDYGCYNSVGSCSDYTIPMSIYVGERFANGVELSEHEGYRYTIDKNMKKVCIWNAKGDKYSVNAGMIELVFDEATYVSVVDIRNTNEFIEENVPSFDPNEAYEAGELVADIFDKEIENVNISAIKDGFTIITEFDYFEGAGDVEYMNPIWSLDDRVNDSIKFFVTKYNELYVEVSTGYEDATESYYRNQYLGKVEAGANELIVNIYNTDNGTFVDAYINSTRVLSTSIFETAWEELYTFCSNENCSFEGFYVTNDPVLKVNSSKVYAGVTVPENITEYTYHVAGDEGLCGTSWDPALNQMEKNEDGIWIKEFTDIAAGTYEFKVVANGEWGYPNYNLYGYANNAGNADITVYTDGATVVVTFDGMSAGVYVVEDEIVPEETTRVEEPSIEEVTTMPSSDSSTSENTYHVAGAAGLCGEDWNPAGNKMDKNDDGTWSKEFTSIAAGTYEFKVVENGAWGNPDFNLEGNASNGGANAVVTVEEDGSTVIVVFDGEKVSVKVEKAEEVPSEEIATEEATTTVEETTTEEATTTVEETTTEEATTTVEETTTEEATTTVEETTTEEETTTVEETTIEEATTTVEETTTEEVTTTVEETTTEKETITVEETTTEEATTTVEETTTEEATTTVEETITEEATTTVEETTTEEETTTVEETTTEAETEKPAVSEPETTKPVENTKEQGKNSAPETVKPNKVVEAEKLVETALQKMETTILKTVELVAPKAQTLTKEVFDTIQTEGKNLTVGVTDENNQLQYSWTFSNKAMNNTNMEIDLTITFDDKKKEEISELTGREDAMYISFAHHGELPGPATIKTYVGDKYKNGDVVYLYYFDEEQQKILMVGNKALTVKGGYVEYTITHCSTYFLMEEKLVGIEKDATSLDDASISLVEPEDETEPSTEPGKQPENVPGLGDVTDFAVWYAMLLLAVGMVMVTGKKREMEN